MVKEKKPSNIVIKMIKPIVFFMSKHEPKYYSPKKWAPRPAPGNVHIRNSS